MDFDMAATRLKRDQQSSLARSRASQKARSATAKARREAQAARAKAERRMKERRLEIERDRMTAEGGIRMLRRVERELGAVDVVGVVGAARVVDASYSSSSPSPSLPPAKTVAASTSAEGSPTFDESPLARGWNFEATSIHGEGDKIALPPSILEAMMTSKGGDLDPWGGGRNGRPIAFRIGIPNPSYGAFPASPKMRALVEAVRREVIASSEKNESAPLERGASAVTDDDIDNDYSNNVSTGPPNEDAGGSHDDNDDDARVMEAYLDELSCRYLSYTHGTVVEFTQEDGRVGLPEPVARALLRSNSHSPSAGRKDIPVRRTVDPASAAVAATGNVSDDDNGCDSSNSKGARDATADAMEVDAPAVHDDGAAGGGAADEGGGERTPGHPAYGLFDIPALPIEVVPMNSLPPGKNCTFVPTASSVRNGFYALKDVKLVLEQSLMRTRATLTRGDVIRTWRRGASYDLVVSSLLSPAGEGYGAVSCVNTDLNVDIGPSEESRDGEGTGSVRDTATAAGGEDVTAESVANAEGGGGRMLSEPSTKVMRSAGSSAPPNGAHDLSNAPKLPPEPAEGVKEGVCSVQIRCRTPSGGSATGRRRFDIAVATMADLFAFASSVCEGVDPASFCLVTRFPRRVFRVSSPSSPSNGGQGGHFAADATLESAGIAEGQEMFMLETI